MKIECAAIRDHDGTVYSVPRPGRHYDVIKLMADQGVQTPITGEQGFLLDDGRFVRRVPAKRIASIAGQLLPRANEYLKELYTEDVW